MDDAIKHFIVVSTSILYDSWPIIVRVSQGDYLVALAGHIVLLVFVLCLLCNQLLTRFDPSLALSRLISTDWMKVYLLAVVVNLCLVAVGLLLINALLIFPAATAMNLSRNLRQLQWTTLGLTVGLSLLGLLVNHVVHVGRGVDLGTSGMIIFLNAVALILSVFLAPVWKRRGEPPALLRRDKCGRTIATFR